MTAIVRESFYTVSGRIFAALQFAGDRLAVGVSLQAEEGIQWTIIDNQVKVGAKMQAIFAAKSEEDIYLYELRPIDHQTKPAVSQVLTVG